MSNPDPSGGTSPSAAPPTAPEIEAEPATADILTRLKLPDPKPPGTNPFLVIDWMLFTAHVAVCELGEARQARVVQLGRKMRTEHRDGIRVLHWEDDVSKRAVESEFSQLLSNQWRKAHSDARKLCAGLRIPFDVYDPLLKAAWVNLEEFWSVIQGVASNKEVYPDRELTRRLHELADSTTPAIAPTVNPLAGGPPATDSANAAADPPAAVPAPLPSRTQQGEGGEPKPNAATEGVLPALLSASDIAARIGRKRESVTSFLTRFADKHRDCRVENPSKRQNEPGYLYRTADVWPALERWMRSKGKR